MPDNGVLIGGHVSVSTTYLDADRRQDVLDYEHSIGRNLDIAHDFYPPHQTWIVDRLNWYIDGGRIPMVTWRVGYNADAFLAGEYDEEIRIRARQAKQVDGQFFSRFFHEMDGDYRLDWDMDGDDGAAKFVDIWKRTRRIFDEEGVTNAIWVWSPATFRRVDSPARYYPGDDQVDWIAVDPYLWNPCRGGAYESLETAIGWEFFEFADAHPTKPIMLAEWGAGTQAGSSNRQDFLNSVDGLLADRGQIAALVYFESDVNAPCDWRLQRDPANLATYRDMVNNPKMRVDLTTLTS